MAAVNLESIDNQAQYAVNRPLPKSLEVRMKIKGTDKGTSGCCILSNGLMVLSNYAKSRVEVLNSDGSLKSIIDISNPFCVSPVNKNQVAVSQPGKDKIAILDVSNEKCFKTLPTRHRPWGITCRGQDVLYCADSVGIMAVNIENGQAQRAVSDTAIVIDSRLAATKDRFCYTCPETHMVVVLDSHYTVMSRFKEETLCRGPSGIAMDEHMNMYVSGSKSRNLVVIAPDGRNFKELYKDSQESNQHYVMWYDSETKGLLLADFFDNMITMWKIVFITRTIY